jgi:hypothetical protein
MTTNPNDILPFRVYETRNLGSVPSYAYLGKNITNELSDQSNLTAFEREQLAENCYNIFLFASVVGGTNVRIDPGDSTDPHIFIDQRWFDLRPIRFWYSWESNVPGPATREKYHEYYDSLDTTILDQSYPDTSPESKNDELINSTNDPIHRIRRVISDGTVIVNANGGRFYWGEDALPHGELENTSPTDTLELQAHEYRVLCEDTEGHCPILNVDNDTDRDGRRYMFRDLEVERNVALFEYDQWLSPTQGLFKEDLSDLVPEGVIKVAYYGACLLNECCQGCPDYGSGSDVATGGGFIIQDLDQIQVTWTESTRGPFITINASEDNNINLRAFLPQCYDWKDPGTTDIKVNWNYTGSTATIKKKDVNDLIDELSLYHGIDGSEWSTIEEFNEILVGKVAEDTNGTNIYTGIVDVEDAVNTLSIVELDFFSAGATSGIIRLSIIVGDPIVYTWECVIQTITASSSSSSVSSSSSSSRSSSSSSRSSSSSVSSSSSRSSSSSSSISSVSSSSSSSSQSSSSSISSSNSSLSSSSSSIPLEPEVQTLLDAGWQGSFNTLVAYNDLVGCLKGIYGTTLPSNLGVLPFNGNTVDDARYWLIKPSGASDQVSLTGGGSVVYSASGIEVNDVNGDYINLGVNWSGLGVTATDAVQVIAGTSLPTGGVGTQTMMGNNTSSTQFNIDYDSGEHRANVGNFNDGIAAQATARYILVAYPSTNTRRMWQDGFKEIEFNSSWTVSTGNINVGSDGSGNNANFIASFALVGPRPSLNESDILALDMCIYEYLLSVGRVANSSRSSVSSSSSSVSSSSSSSSSVSSSSSSVSSSQSSSESSSSINSSSSSFSSSSSSRSSSSSSASSQSSSTSSSSSSTSSSSNSSSSASSGVPFVFEDALGNIFVGYFDNQNLEGEEKLNYTTEFTVEGTLQTTKQTSVVGDPIAFPASFTFNTSDFVGDDRYDALITVDNDTDISSYVTEFVVTEGDVQPRKTTAIDTVDSTFPSYWQFYNENTVPADNTSGLFDDSTTFNFIMAPTIIETSSSSSSSSG